MLTYISTMAGKSYLLSQRLCDALLASGPKLVLADEHIQFSGEQALEMSESIANYIEALTQPHSRVAIAFPNSAILALLIIAVVRSGRVPTLLSQTDFLNQPEQNLAMSQPALLLIAEGFEKLVPSGMAFITLSRDGKIIASSRPSSLSLSLYDHQAQSPEGTALILFTSGSTGKPKGVFIPESGLLATAEDLISRFQLNSHTVSPIVLPVCHSMALNTQMFPTLLAGGVCYFTNARLSLGRVYRNILAHKSTFVSLISEVLIVCAEEKRDKNLPYAESVEHVQLAGGLISETHLRLAQELFPNAIIHKGYGLTEAIRVSMIDSRDPDFISASTGLPLPFVQIEVRNEKGALCLPREIGEIFVKGPNVFLGYLEESKIKKDFLDQNHFLSTGDYGFLNERQQLNVVGRQDSLFKINGVKVSGFEIEKASLDSSSHITAARCILGSDVKRLGQKIVLFLEIRKESHKKFLADEYGLFQKKLWENFQKLNHFPREIILLNEFPKTANGKVYLKKLNEMITVVQQNSYVDNTENSLKFYQTF